MGTLVVSEIQQPETVSSLEKKATPKWFFVSFALTLLVLNLGIWLSSGTLAPYAGTALESVPTVPCHYLVSVDHGNFKDTFWMLAGADRRFWEGSVVLRRILYPLLSYPLMSVLGFEIGGFVFNLVLHSVVFTVFALYMKDKHSSEQSIVAMWLLALYPGIYYWAGLPYAYASIVPCSLLGFIILSCLSEEDNSSKIYLLCFRMGILFLAYDLLFAFFGVGAFLILLYRKNYKLIPGSLILLAAPSLLSNFILTKFFDVPLMSSNSHIYTIILRSYFEPADWGRWWALLRQLPEIGYQVYLYSNFLFIPALFTILVAVAMLLRKLRSSSAERSLLLAGIVLFLFLNLAPPYEGWQMRGVWIARLYQPIFVALVTFCSREIVHHWRANRPALRSLAACLFLAACLGNFLVTFGPVMHNHLSSQIYQRFYRHSPPETLYDSVTRYGRRPLGFCDPKLPPAFTPYHL